MDKLPIKLNYYVVLYDTITFQNKGDKEKISSIKITHLPKLVNEFYCKDSDISILTF